MSRCQGLLNWLLDKSLRAASLARVVGSPSSSSSSLSTLASFSSSSAALADDDNDDVDDGDVFEAVIGAALKQGRVIFDEFGSVILDAAMDVLGKLEPPSSACAPLSLSSTARAAPYWRQRRLLFIWERHKGSRRTIPDMRGVDVGVLGVTPP